ncbi:MAG: helix-turn-helix transcriptional regulator [Flavisolibacter sp.]|nr:helix-turn-helix transcriptional regulator [Flavisolibacter sp.]
MHVAETIFHQLDTSSLALEQLVYESGQQIPGSVHYTIKRFAKPSGWMSEDVGVFRYHFEPRQPEKNHLELRFCITGNMYCRQYQDECNRCPLHETINCHAQVESLDVFNFVFTSTLLAQFVKSRFSEGKLTEDVMAFKYPASFIKKLPLCSKTRVVLDGLLSHNFTDTLENIYINAQTQMLLLYSLDCMMGEKEIDMLACKFLANEADREKIVKAREILIQHIGEPITIKELSRKVAMNECYLKKGFKELYGTTIFDFYQSQRMEHAKFLLYEKGLSVTEVSVLLGYSSISHFSTAFKRHTGLKPCELLLR